VSRPLAIRLDPRDNVATALQDLRPGTGVDVGGNTEPVTLLETVGFGHKMALCEIRKGEDIIKCGHCMGVATHPIAAGSHVHVHNVVSCRAR
jgi:hypothetical protein